LFVVFLAPVLTYGAQVSLNSASLTPTTAATINVAYLSDGSQTSAIQFDLTYDSSAISVTATLGNGLRSSAKTLYSAVPGTNQFRVAIIGLDQDIIPDGALVSFSINLLPNAANGNYPISLVGGVASEPDGSPVGVSSSSAMITVTGGRGGGGGGGNPSITLRSVVNAASLRPGPIAPGELIALFGTGIGPAQPTSADVVDGRFPTSLGGITIMFDGVTAPAPLLYADSSQINAVVPYELPLGSLAVLTLLQNGLSVAVIELGVTPVSPALFSLDENGAGQVIALNQDGSLNTALNPASANTWVTLFLTGCGSFTPMGATGDVFPPIQTGQLVLPVQAAMQGKPATVGYAGPAPGMINSVSVVVVRVPNAVVANPRTGLSLGFGGQWTPETVQIAVTP